MVCTCVAFEAFYMYLVYTPDGIVLVCGYYITCLNLLFSNRRVQIYIFRSEGCWTCALMRRTDPPAKDVEHAGDILDRGRWVQFVRRPESMIWSIGRGRRKVVSWCQAAERSRRIFDET